MDHVVFSVALTDPSMWVQRFSGLLCYTGGINGHTEQASTQFPRTVTENKIREIKKLNYNGKQKYTSN
jgi:hypothetical protein